MMVVAIMAVITAWGAPNFITWQAKSHLRQGVSELHSNLNLARMVAMNRNTTVTVTMTGGAGAAVRATFVDAAGTAVLAPVQMLAQVTAWAGTPAAAPFTVRFNSLGLRVGGGAGNQVITITNSRGLAYEIQITAAGKARWCAASPCP
jgi:Tfp pilus assembly protein FimT